MVFKMFVSMMSAFFLFASFVIARDGGPAMTDAEMLASVESLIDEMVKADKFSGVVLMAKGGKVVFHKAYGLANKTHNVANRADTKFNIGSINKTFTQIAIGKLIEQGRLSLNDTIGEHLADYPNRNAAMKVTIKHLLNMTSGIGDFFGAKYDATPKDRIRRIADYLPLFAAEPLLFEPGTGRRYSNGGYAVLGAIIEKVTGRSYYDFVRDHIFKPLDMSSTDSYEQDLSVPNIATGYTLRTGAGPNGERRNNIYTLPARASSAGGGYSTAEDLLKFMTAFVDGRLLKPETMEQIFPNHGPSPGDKKIAVTRRPAGGGEGFAGGAPGINALVEADFDTGYIFVVLSNYDPPIAESLGNEIGARLRRLKK